MTYLMVLDAARLLKLTGQAVRNMANQGKLPVAAVTAKGNRLFHAEAVMRLAAERDREERRRVQRKIRRG